MSALPARATERRPKPAGLGAPPLAPLRRRPFRDSPRLILAGMLLLVGALAGTLAIANRTARLSPDFLSEVVLYALSVADLTLLVALAFVLARNIIKMIVERRRGLPFARFRAKLVAVLVGTAVIPAVLVLLVGSELIRASVDRWFNAPMDEVLASANQIAGEYYRERQMRVTDHATRIARALAAVDLTAADVARIERVIAPEVAERGVGMVGIYRVTASTGPAPDVVPVVEVAAPLLPHGDTRGFADRLAARAVAGSAEPRLLEPLGTGGELIRAAALVRRPDGKVAGVVVASDYLTGDLAARSRQMTAAYEDYTQLRVLKGPLRSVYLSFFLMVTLMILVGAIWMGVYLAKRITRPIQMLAAGAREIGAGHFDYRLEPETTDEFGALVEAFNSMASELAASRRKLERSTVDLQRKHLEVEGRRRYIETILERIATGVVSIDAAGRVSTLNSAAVRLLGLSGETVGQPAATVFQRPDLRPVGALLEGDGRDGPAREIALARDGRDLHLAAAVTTLHGEEGSADGRVLVFDDVTPLIRAQKVAAWREVARRLAHEIKNPLTPIQLCAERMRRHFGGAPPPTRQLVEECTTTIVGEVESLKSLVDEFSQFARMPAPRAVPTDLGHLVEETLALYDGLFDAMQIEGMCAPDLDPVRVDPEQIRRVIINLVDNALEAVNRRGRVVVEAAPDEAAHVVRIVVADDGPGIPAEDRDKLFMPYYSTKRRGSGLGLAIVRRIIAEHGGTIQVGDNVPRGTRFTIELPR